MIIESTPRKLTDEERIIGQTEFEEVFGRPEKEDEIYQLYHQFFLNASPEKCYEMRLDFFGWYVDLTWKRLTQISSSSGEIATVFAKQTYIASLLGYDLIKEMVHYLNACSLGQKEMESLYQQIRVAYLESSAIIGNDKSGAAYRIGQLITSLTKLDADNDSLRIAEYISSLKEIISPVDESICSIDDPVHAITTQLFSFTRFLLGVESDKIYYLVETNFYPNEYMAANSLTEENESNLSTEELADAQNETTPPLSFENIKSLIESRFPYDNSGQFTNLEGVLAMLDTLAEEQGDERIRDLYVYDEMTGVFRWNGELLGDSNNI